MNRRLFFRSAAASAAALAISGCRHTRPVEPIPGSSMPAGCALPPVRVTPEREIRTVAGLRPYRPSGFVVSPERIGDVLVIHNYGHGGGGITLSWGTARLAVDMVPPDHLYMFPRSDRILLGGTHESGVWSLDPDVLAKERIVSRHREFFEHFHRC